MSAAVRRLLDLVTSRLFVRMGFLAFFVWAGSRLFGFVAWARGEGPYVPRPEAVAGLLPIGHFTSFFAWLRGGGWDTLLPAGLVIILGALAVSFLFKRGFCGWICPLGTVWEIAASLGRMGLGRNLRLPARLDLALRILRYVLAAVVMGLLLMLPIAEAVAFRELPYMWIADIKILQSFTSPAYVLIIALALILSSAFGAVWCRYLCPVGGLYGAVGFLSPFKVRRDAEACVDCGRCSKSCHASIDVAAVTRPVSHTECDGCMDCVKVCPAPGALEARGPAGVTIDPRVWALLVVALWLGIWGTAKLTGAWDTTIPDETFKQVIRSGIIEERTPGGL